MEGLEVRAFYQLEASSSTIVAILANIQRLALSLHATDPCVIETKSSVDASSRVETRQRYALLYSVKPDDLGLDCMVVKSSDK